MDDLRRHLTWHHKKTDPILCPFLHDDARQCDFGVDPAEIVEGDQDSANIGSFWRHAEEVHGFVYNVPSTAAVLCTAHSVWCFGVAQLEEHHATHVLAAAHDVPEPWMDRLCRFCLNDTRLPNAIRGRFRDRPDMLKKHVLYRHIYQIRTREVLCPYCNEAISSPVFPMHLRDEHALNLFRRNHVSGSVDDLSGLLSVSAPSDLQGFIDFASDLEVTRFSVDPPDRSWSKLAASQHRWRLLAVPD